MDGTIWGSDAGRKYPALTAQSIMSGEYPLADGYYAVVRSDLPQDHPARAIIAWLQSEGGYSVIERAGLMSLRPEG